MENEFLKLLNELYKKRDLKVLQDLAKPTNRELNKSNRFKSALMLSCNNIKHLSKISSLEADCIMFNLEDGVSQEQKPFALVLCAIFLSHLKTCEKKLVVRVNALDEGGYEEIRYLNAFQPDAIRVPKIEDEKEVKKVLEVLDNKIELHLSIETASAWRNLDKLNLSGGVKCFYLGILDLFADMKLSQDLIKRDNPTMLYMLSHFLITSKSIGVKPVSFVFQDYQNLDEFGMWISLEKQMGYDAKGCISPNQVKAVNDMFYNDKDEIDKAQEIVRLFEQNKAKGISGFVDEKYGFIDEPIYKGALVILKAESNDSKN